MDSINKIVRISTSILFYTLSFLFVAFLLSLLYFSLLSKDRIPRFFNYYALQIMSGSMSPTFNAGDYILIKKQKEYKEGDIVTYEQGKHLVTHRIVYKKGDTIVTKGDANDSNDNPVKTNKILGKYLLTSMLIGFFVKYRFIILLVMFLLYVIWKLMEYIINNDIGSDSNSSNNNIKRKKKIILMDEDVI